MDITAVLINGEVYATQSMRYGSLVVIAGELVGAPGAKITLGIANRAIDPAEKLDYDGNKNTNDILINHSN